MAFVLHIVSHTLSFNICTFGLICSCVTVLAIGHQSRIKQPDVGQLCSLIGFTVCETSAHMFDWEAPCFLSHVKFTCRGPILGIFLLLLRSFTPLSSSGFFFSVFISLALGIIRLTSIYMLRCWGDRISWDFFTSLPLRSFSPSSFLPVLHVWACVIEPYSFISHIINKV